MIYIFFFVILTEGWLCLCSTDINSVKDCPALLFCPNIFFLGIYNLILPKESRKKTILKWIASTMNLKTKDTSSCAGETFYFNAKIKIQYFSATNKQKDK